MPTPKSEFIAGMKAVSPILLGVIPFSTITGIAAVEIGVSPVNAMSMAAILFAGASHLAALQLIGENAAILVIILTVVIINLRFVMYSASLAPHFRHFPQRWKPLLAHIVTDQSYAVSIIRFNLEPDMAHKLWFYLGAAIPMVVVWLGGNLAGIFLGTQVPSSWSLDFAVPLTFLALAVPAIKGRASMATAVTAGIVVIAAAGMPFNLSLIAAILSAIVVGLVVERQLMPNSPAQEEQA
jgi:predicted branched-subunit amino acid permease